MPHSKNHTTYFTGFSLALICAALTGCATRLSPPMTGYTCCNLRPYYSAVSSSNMLGGSILPAGTAVSLEHVKRGRYYGYVGDDYVTLSDDSPRAEGDSPWIGQVVVQTDPKIEYSTWSPRVQNAVLSAKVIPGMTKAQVLMALSYPPPRHHQRSEWHDLALLDCARGSDRRHQLRRRWQSHGLCRQAIGRTRGRVQELT